MANKKQPIIEDKVNTGYIDLTKTGPISYRELQMLNGSLPQESEANSLLPDDIGVASTLSRAGKVNYTETPSDWGNSMFDSEVANQYEFENYGDYRGERQPWYAKIGAGLAKGAVLACTTFLDGTVGLVLGIGTAIKEDRWSGLWDNDFSKAMQSINELSEEVLPNYYTQDEQNNPWDHIFSANFIGDKFIKNLGFTIGAFYSGGLEAAGIKGLGKLAMAGAKRLGAGIKTLKGISNTSSIVAAGLGSATSAVNEGRIEALNNSKDWFELHKAQLDDIYSERIRALQDEYEANAGKQFVRSSNGENVSFADPAYTKLQQAIAKEKEAYNKALGRLTEDRLKMGNADLLMNIPILTASNIIQFGKLYANGFKTARKAINVVGKPGEYKAGTTKLGAAYNITKGALSEGNEEILQSAANKIAVNYYATDVNNFYKSKIDRDAAQETLNWTKSFAEGINETVNDGSAWEEFFIGSLTGALGMPRFRGIRNAEGKLQSPITLEDGAFNEWREYNAKIARENEIAKYMNNRINSSEFKNYYQGLVRHNKYQNDMNRAAEEGNEFDFKNAEHAQLVSDIVMFDHAGKLEDLKSAINEASGTSQKDLESAVVNTTSKDDNGNLIGPFSQYASTDDNGNIIANFGTEEDVDNMASKINKNKKDIIDTIKKYQDIKDELILKTDQQLSDDQLEELTWMKSQISNWSDRAETMSDGVRFAINNVLGGLNSLLKFHQQVRDFEGQSHADLTDRYLQADKNVKDIEGTINTFNLVISQDGKTLAHTLATSPKFVDSLIKRINEIDETILSADEKEDITTKLNDIIKIGNASKTYNAKLKEYLENPQKQVEDHAKIDKQNIDKDAEITRAKQVEALNRTINFQEVEELINNGEVTFDDLDSSNSDAAKEYKKASLFKKKATELINNSDNEHKAELLDMLNRRFNESATYDDLNNEALVTEFPLEALTWDEKEQETLEHVFNNILKQARDKVNSGNSQKQNVEAKKTGVTKPANVGKDDVEQPPADKPFSVDETINKIDKLNIVPEAKTEAKALASQIAKNIEKLSKSKDIKLIRQTQRRVNALSTMVGNDAIVDIIDRVRELSKSDTLNPSSLEEVLGEAEAEMNKFKPTAVTGVLKAIIPQFDLDAKRDGVLIPFVEDGRNSTYAYVYRRLSEPQGENTHSSAPNKPIIIKKHSYIGPKGEKIEVDVESEPVSFNDLKVGDVFFRPTTNEPFVIGENLGNGQYFVYKYDSDPSKKGIVAGFPVGTSEGQPWSNELKGGVYRIAKSQQATNINNEVNTDIPKKYIGKTAFDYVNEGNIKEGDELEVRYEEATDEHPELLALYHNGMLVNYMNTDESIDGVKEIKDKAKKGEKPTVRVSKIMDGQYGYNRAKPQSIGELLGIDDATIGVMKNRSMEANTDTFIEPVFDEANSDGNVYILLPNSKGTLSPKRVFIRHLNKTEFDLATQDNPIANDLKKAFNDLAKLANLEKGFDEALDNVYMDLIELLYIPDSFHINIISKANEVSLQIAFDDRNGKRQNRNILLKKFANKSLLHVGEGSAQESESYTASIDEVYNQVLNAFYEANLSFNVSAKKLIGNKGQEYANRLRDSNVLATYLTGKRMQGTWFLLNEKPNTTHTDSAFERAKAAQQAKGGTRVQYGGKEYFVRNGVIFDQTGSIVDLEENAQQVKDIAYINSAYGNNYFGVNQHDGKVLIIDSNGKRGYNRATNKYLSPKEVEELEATLEGRKSKASQTATAVQSLQDSQKLVLRDDNGNPDTSSGSYMIKEDDGQYHEYQRVHSVIGSNYIGPSKGDAATSRGSLVDEVARQFFTDPTKVTKPEEMSDEAFGALIKGLGKFRDYANKRGLKLVTDRTVVFHKYSDGRRVAGELDVFAYNPSTGEVSIFDFKTSKYSVRDTAFSRVTNPRMFTRSNKDQYTLQLSAYAKLFEDSFGVPVSNLVIIPFQIKYSREKNGGISRVFPEDYVPLTYQKDVFKSSDKAPTSKTAPSLKTIKGQYVTMGTGKPEYHQADMQVLFTTGNNQTFYLAKVGDSYKLIIPNGRSITIESSLVSDEAGRTRNNIMDFIQADNVAAAIQDAMSTSPLENSPYGNSIELKDTPKEHPEPDDRMKRGFEALDRLESLKAKGNTVTDPRQEAINKREKEEKATVAIDTSTALGRSQLARKKWREMTDAEKAIISPMFEGMKEKDIQEYWDGTDATQRESFIPACK